MLNSKEDEYVSDEDISIKISETKQTPIQQLDSN
jgi:hypothetical protein